MKFDMKSLISSFCFTVGLLLATAGVVLMAPGTANVGVHVSSPHLSRNSPLSVDYYFSAQLSLIGIIATTQKFTDNSVSE